MKFSSVERPGKPSKAGGGVNGAPPSSLSSIYAFLVTNLVSLVLGVGLGAWIHRRTTSPVRLL